MLLFVAKHVHYCVGTCVEGDVTVVCRVYVYVYVCSLYMYIHVHVHVQLPHRTSMLALATAVVDSQLAS